MNRRDFIALLAGAAAWVPRDDYPRTRVEGATG
jgi:hypothetical protein